MLARRHDEAIAQLLKTVRLNPAFATAHVVLVDAYAHQQEYDEALREADRASALGARGADLRASVGYTLALADRRAEAASIISELVERYQNNEDETAGGIASIYSALRTQTAPSTGWKSPPPDTSSGSRTLTSIRSSTTFVGMRDSQEFFSASDSHADRRSDSRRGMDGGHFPEEQRWLTPTPIRICSTSSPRSCPTRIGWIDLNADPETELESWPKLTDSEKDAILSRDSQTLASALGEMRALATATMVGSD